MEIPRSIVPFNRAINNPIQRQFAWLVPPWIIVVHRGRKSGRVYRTPVIAFRSGEQLAIPVLYGTGSDWVRNLLAGGGQVVRAGRTHSLHDLRVVPADASLAKPARFAARMADSVLVAELGPADGAFGRGPRAGAG